MGIIKKKPPMKLSVKSQYCCFATAPSGEEKFSGTYEEDVEKTDTVKTVEVADEGESTDVYSSGKVYDTVETVLGRTIEVEEVAIEPSTLVKMKGYTVDESGLVMSGSQQEKTYFAWGYAQEFQSGHVKYTWYPKCKLVESPDESSTKEESFSEQNASRTIKAYPLDDNTIEFVYDSQIKKLDWMTEELFFSKVINSVEAFTSLNPTRA